MLPWAISEMRLALGRERLGHADDTFADGLGGHPLYDALAPSSACGKLETCVALDQLPASGEDRRRPALFVGVIDIRHGGCIAFKGEELTYDDILASSAVPPLYRAVHARGALHWDGRFRRNSPIREFTELRDLCKHITTARSP